MKLTAEQRKIAQEIVRRGKRRGASPMEIEAALETGLVESGLRNLDYGDADSKGWRQERASLYKDPTNLAASIERFYNETRAAKQRKKYMRSGDLAADVQRPREDLRGKYEQRDGDAEAILRQLVGGARGGSSSGGDTITTRTTTTTPGVDNSALRKQLLQQYLLQRGRPDALLSLAQGLKDAQDIPGTSRTSSSTRRVRKSQNPVSSGASSSRRPSDQLTELFHDPTGTGIKRGKHIGPIGGHGSHVHVATGPKQLAQIKKLATDMGLTITSTTGGKHAPNSYHYQGRAVDVAGDPERMKAFTRAVAKRYGVRL